MTDMIVPSFDDETPTGRKLAIICSKGNLDMAYPGLILANAALGEGIDKKDDDFASEVAKLAKGGPAAVKEAERNGPVDTLLMRMPSAGTPWRAKYLAAEWLLRAHLLRIQQDPALAGLISNEGALRDPRVPGV